MTDPSLAAHRTWLLDLVRRLGYPHVEARLPGRNIPILIAATAQSWRGFVNDADEIALEAAWRGIEDWENALRLELAEEDPRAS